jgi:hypothetical protein
MTSVWALAALWLGLALIASLLSIWFRISTAMSEIMVGTIAAEGGDVHDTSHVHRAHLRDHLRSVRAAVTLAHQ